MIKASIVGASGYAGGELLRLLLSHPEVELSQATSESNTGKYVHQVHPNLRGRGLVQFSSLSELKGCDVLFLALPHGKAAGMMDRFTGLAPKIIDLSADFRLKDPEVYKKYYGREHPRPDLLNKFVYGLPELHRDEIRKADFVSGVGCNATSVILPLYPLFKKGIAGRVVAEAKAGSSEAGNKPSLGSHHPERSGAVRSFAPTSHRHVAEMIQELGMNGKPEIHFSATSIEMVRGILSTSHVFLNRDATELEIRKIYREAYGNEPFVRIVKEASGIYRYPEPKILLGSNYCDIGFEKDAESERLVVMAAIDNLMKGAAGTAVQCMNLMFGFDERASLEFAGLHPI